MAAAAAGSYGYASAPGDPVRGKPDGVMHPMLILQLLILIAVANGTPVAANKLLGDKFAWPLDGGAVFLDGRPLLGRSKTIRGAMLALFATTLAALPLGFHWEIGAVVAAGAITGDLLSSFVKRRLGLAPSSMAIGLDQIPESLLPLAACRLLLPVTLLDIAAGTMLFFAGELVLSRILYRLRLRDRPY